MHRLYFQDCLGYIYTGSQTSCLSLAPKMDMCFRSQGRPYCRERPVLCIFRIAWSTYTPEVKPLAFHWLLSWAYVPTEGRQHCRKRPMLLWIFRIAWSTYAPEVKPLVFHWRLRWACVPISRTSVLSWKISVVVYFQDSLEYICTGSQTSCLSLAPKLDMCPNWRTSALS